MEESPRSTLSRSSSGSLIRLQTRLSGLFAWPGPAWAALCGVVASAGFGWHGRDLLRLALLILLVDGGWGTLWTALGGTDWATPLNRWRNWRSGEPAKKPPYTLPGSPGERVSDWLGQLRAWWQNVLWPTCGAALSAIAVALPVSLVLGVLLGRELLLLSAAALAVMQIGAWDGNRQGPVSPTWDSVIGVGLSWLAGHAAFGALTLPTAALALAFTLAWGAACQSESSWERALVAAGQLLAAALLALLHQPIAAGCLFLLLVPQLLLSTWMSRGQPVHWYTRHARFWVMAAMFVAARAL